MTLESSDAKEMGMVKLDRSRFARFSSFITRELGIRMSPAKLPMLQSRLQRRLRQLQIKTVDAYEEYLFNSPDSSEELVHFLDLVTTNKTDFFREPKHFDFLYQTVLPTLEGESGRSGNWNFRLWCAGCSSGQEAYTLAMVLSEYAEPRSAFSFSLLATDISVRVLQEACDGIYPEELIAPVPLAFRKKYLLRSKDPAKKLVSMTPELRGKIRFGRLNFMEEEYGLRDKFDVIFFRNVMIYFDKPTQQKVVDRLCRHLRPGGYFFISHSESLMGLDLPLKMAANSVYRKIR